MNEPIEENASKSPNDPSSETAEAGAAPARRALRGAGAVTAVAVLCSAWLGVSLS